MSLWEDKETVERVLVTADDTYILVQYSSPSSEGKKQKDMLLFNVAAIPSAAIPDSSAHKQNNPTQN